MATRMTARAFVGRAPQLAELRAALADAAAGRPSLAFVAGEPGVGKTRLLEELIRHARAGGARVISGDCVRLGDGELPYAPLLAALRPLARDDDPVFATLSAGARDALGTLMPALAPIPTVAGGAGADPTDVSAQGRVFEALLELVDRLGADGPVVLVVEDAHWADASTRSFLRFLSANLCSEPLLLVASYRPDELHRRHPLLPLLAELERDPRARRVTLAPFTREELTTQLEDILGAAPDDALVDRLHRRTDGNALFAEELLAAGLDGRSAVPPTLRDALMVRIERLGDDAQELLRLMAVARTVDHPTLAATATVDGVTLRDALREAVAAHILAVDPSGRYRFRHALLREAVGDDLLPGERADLHLRLARALEGLMADAGGVHRAAAVAHHYLAGGDQTAALVASVRAADEAEVVHAYGEKAALLERTLELWARVPDPEALTGTTEAALLERAAVAYDNEGDRTRMETLLKRAIDLTDEAVDPLAASRLLERLARARWSLNRQDESLQTLDRSLALLPDGPSPERAWRLAAMAKYLMLMGRFQRAVTVAEDAREQARQTGARRAEGRIANALGVSLMGLGDLEAGAATLREAGDIAREIDQPFDYASAAVNLADILHLSGRTDEALGVVTAADEELRRELGRLDSWVVLARAEFELEAGSWGPAAERLASVGRRHQGTTLVNFLLRRAELALGRGDFDAAGESLERAARSAEGSREPQFTGVLAAHQATLALHRDDHVAARAFVADGLDVMEFCTEDGHRIARLAAMGVRVEADIAQRARDLGDLDAAGDALARADLLLARVRAVCEADDEAESEGAAVTRPVERAHCATAMAERARAAGTADPDAWARAAAAWAEVGRPYSAAQARWREAEAHVLGEDRETATVVAAAALATADELGSAWLADEVRALVARARLRPRDLRAVTDRDAASTSADDAGHGAADDPFGLTTRERQVLALVAGGATNREVGARLYMAEKTASVHVSRILAKLDVRSRTEAAAVAHRLGLADG